MSATVFVQPLDLIKNRMQLSGESGLRVQHVLRGASSVGARDTVVGGRGRGAGQMYSEY